MVVRSLPTVREGQAKEMGTHEFERLVALYMKATAFVDRAMVEAYMGDNALSDGLVTKANEHFSASRHHWREAERAEAEFDDLLASLADEHRTTTSREALAAEALAAARERLYGMPSPARPPRLE